MPKNTKKNAKKQVPLKYHTLAGSERPSKPATRQLKEASAAEIVTVQLTVRRRPGGPPLKDLNYFQKVPLRSRKLLSRQEFEEAHGAAQEDLDAVGKFCQSHDLEVVETNRSRRRVKARGTVAQMNSAFAVRLRYYESAHGKYRGFEGAVGLPVALEGIVETVIGLDNRPVPTRRLGGADPSNTNPLTPVQVANLYHFPPGTGEGQTIGTWQDQGYGFNPSDVSATLQSWGLSPLPPAPTAFPPGSNSGISDIETIIDLTIAAAIAPKASIVAYICQGPAASDIIDTLQSMIHPGPGDPVPGILFICYVWSADDETSYISAQEYTQMDTLFQEAANLGITVLTGSGDTGAYVDNATQAQTIYPASDPYLLTCGGTTIGNSSASGFDEYVWNDTWINPSTGQSFAGATGGGVSALFPVPPYQTGIINLPTRNGTGNPGRGVPDVAGNASQNSGYYIIVTPEGEPPLTLLEGGTSAVAPLYAGLVARLNETLDANVGFLNPTLYALCTVGTSVCRTVPSPAGQGPTNNSYNGVTGYPAGVGLGWNACTGFGSIDGTKLLNGLKAALPNPRYYFQVNKGSYGQNEVIQNTLYSNPTPMWLVVEGFSPNEVANTVAAQGLPSVQAALPHVSVVPGAAVPENPNAMDSAQRVFFPCTVSFIGTSVYNTVSQGGIFPDPGTVTPTQCLLTASSFTVNGQALPPAETILMLDPGAAPYFGNFANNGDFFLSQDLRVFTVTPGTNATPIMGVTLQPANHNNNNWDTKAAYTYIQALLKKLNSSSYNDPSGGDVFSTFPNQTDALGADSMVTPFTSNPADPNQPFANYAFAVARVRINGFPNQSSVANVRVLFRLFAAQTSDTDFQPQTYPSTTDSAGQPLAPLLGVNEVTIPFFATGNYESNSDYQVNNDYSTTSTSVNNQPVNLGPSGQRYAYYGCYLNVNPLENTITIGTFPNPVSSLLPSTHCCLVAQLVYDDAPMPTAADEPQGPEYTNNFAQRNLQVTTADNPGPPAAQRVPQTFDARPSPAPGTGQLEDYPDELMIDWGNTPAGSIASIYWPGVASSDVLALAQKFSSTYQLSATDAHTVQCFVQTGFTFVPIPQGAGENFAGLFAVNLVQWVTAGQTFTITVRRISTRRAAAPPPQPPPPPQPKIEAVTAESVREAPGETMSNWRYVVGTFAVRIPVVTGEVMLPLEENYAGDHEMASVPNGAFKSLGARAGALHRPKRGTGFWAGRQPREDQALALGLLWAASARWGAGRCRSREVSRGYGQGERRGVRPLWRFRGFPPSY